MISLKTGEIQGFDHLTPDKTCKVDKVLSDVSPDDYEALAPSATRRG